jgi:hypothetical protein
MLRIQSQHTSHYSRGAQAFQKSSSHLRILGAMKVTWRQVPYSEPTNIRCHRAKFCWYSGQVSGICVSLHYTIRQHATCACTCTLTILKMMSTNFLALNEAYVCVLTKAYNSLLNAIRCFLQNQLHVNLNFKQSRYCDKLIRHKTLFFSRKDLWYSLQCQISWNSVRDINTCVDRLGSNR